jgi:hypothetical protein
MDEPEVLTGPISVRAARRADMDDQLGPSADHLREQARLLGDRGVLVTRNSSREFTVELSTEVPYGLTYERCRWDGRT